MTVVHHRDDWTQVDLGCTDRFDPSEVVGVAIHWVGSGLSAPLAEGQSSAVAEFLRGCRSHNVSDGYCDIEYNTSVAADGDRWRCRGLEHDGGANGTTDANDRYVSILAIYPVGGKITAKQIDGIRDEIRTIRGKYPNAKKIKPHQHFVPTQCPGPHALRLINDGVLDPDYVNLTRLRKRAKKVRGRLADVRDLYRRIMRKLRGAEEARHG